MKRVLAFIGLKIVEIGGVLFALFIGSSLMCWIETPTEGANPYAVFFFTGLGGLCVIGLGIFIIFLLWQLIKLNWEITEKMGK